MSTIDDSLSVAVQRKHFEHNCFENSKNEILRCLGVQRLTNYPIHAKIVVCLLCFMKNRRYRASSPSFVYRVAISS